MTLATTVSLAVLRGPVPLAKALAAIDILSEGRLVAALGPGSSKRDYEALGVSFEERWKRFDEAIAVLRALLTARAVPRGRALLPRAVRYRARAGAPAPHPSVDRELGIEGRAGSSCEGGRRLACLRLQHNSGGVLRRSRPVGAQTRGSRQGCGRLSQRARDDVDLGLERSSRERSSPRRRLGSTLESRSRRASRAGVRRLGGALRRTPLTLRRGRVWARLPVAVGRRAAATRAGRRRGGSECRLTRQPARYALKPTWSSADWSEVL